VIIKQDDPVESLRGRLIVPANGRPLEGVLVEVFDKPEGLLLDWRQREALKAQQFRIAACITGPDGEFHFKNIPPGNYELRSSKPIEWNSTSIYVVVDPQNQNRKSKIVVPLEPSN
jgi:protocatechuate 3,4-dioxygenase beta subunit